MLLHSTAETMEADAAAEVVLLVTNHAKYWKTMTVRWMLRLATAIEHLLSMKFPAIVDWRMGMRLVMDCRRVAVVDTPQNRTTDLS